MAFSLALLARRTASSFAMVASILMFSLGTPTPAAASSADCDSAGCRPLLPPIPILCELLPLPPLLTPCPKAPSPTPTTPPPTTSTTRTPAPPPQFPQAAPVVPVPVSPQPPVPPRRTDSRPTESPTPSTTATTAVASPTNTRPTRQVTAAQPGAEHQSTIEKQRRWALAMLIMVLGAGLVTAAAKRRAR